jgi:hypothetical protein
MRFGGKLRTGSHLTRSHQSSAASLALHKLCHGRGRGRPRADVLRFLVWIPAFARTTEGMERRHENSSPSHENVTEPEGLVTGPQERHRATGTRRPRGMRGPTRADAQTRCAFSFGSPHSQGRREGMETSANCGTRGSTHSARFSQFSAASRPARSFTV